MAVEGQRVHDYIARRRVDLRMILSADHSETKPAIIHQPLCLDRRR